MLRKFWIFVILCSCCCWPVLSQNLKGVIDPDEVPNVTSIQETLEVKLLSPELGPSTTMLSFDPNLNLEWNSVLDPQVFKNFSSFGVIRNYEKIDFVISPIGLDGVVMKIITGHESKDSKLTSFGRKYFNKYQTEDVEKYIHEILLKLGHSDGSLDLQFVNFTETYQIINATQKFNPIFNHFNEVFGIRTNRNFEEYLQNLKSEYVPISTFHFSMEFNQPMQFLTAELLDFYTGDNEVIQLEYQCGYIELSVQPVGNRDTLLSIPMKDKRFKFFVYYKNDTNSMNKLPQLNMERLITALRNPKPSTYESIILPGFNIFHVGNFTSVFPNQGLNPVCILQKKETCIYLRRILQGSRFKLTNYGVNVPIRPRPDYAQISGPVIQVNRPFYYGIWFKDENYETFVYFGSFLGLLERKLIPEN